ncbi:hypothetical protein [Thermomonas aquatica]|uniref:Uncharacterized protein n=1 Tax=Thermomonas aquatica TaxID=2202149 RepID=A0A5B7ZPA5_9GAMM|nr:hypothetical protein [Thermomonas aquatica]QDA56445.1 hypothetical protein FHQ07_03525 [Thermomonas aquatica]
MYKFPSDLDLSPLIGAFTTQVLVGQYDLQFYFGDSWLATQSTVELTKDQSVVGRWEPGRWPDPAFHDVMNVAVTQAIVKDDRNLVITLDNGLSINFTDNSDQFESMQIRIAGGDMIIV